MFEFDVFKLLVWLGILFYCFSFWTLTIKFLLRIL